VAGQLQPSGCRRASYDKRSGGWYEQAPSGSGASEDAPNASGADPSEADQIDAQHQSCNPLVVQGGGGGGIRTRRLPAPLPEVRAGKVW
jgi:hypothetical protein